MERRLQEAFELACSACELPVPRIVSAPRTEDLVMTISNVCVCDFAWLAQLLDKVSKNEQFAALVGVAGHEMSHTIDPKFWPRIERERLADPRLLDIIHRRKTACMIEASAVMGGISAGASEHLERSLRNYGGHLGLAFQIADDVLDAEATTEVLGKTAGKDVVAGKLTYVKCYGVAAARTRARAEADRAVDALSGFGHEADWLRDLARFVVQRTF